MHALYSFDLQCLHGILKIIVWPIFHYHFFFFFFCYLWHCSRILLSGDACMVHHLGRVCHITQCILMSKFSYLQFKPILLWKFDWTSQPSLTLTFFTHVIPWEIHLYINVNICFILLMLFSQTHMLGTETQCNITAFLNLLQCWEYRQYIHVPMKVSFSC